MQQQAAEQQEGQGPQQVLLLCKYTDIAHIHNYPQSCRGFMPGIKGGRTSFFSAPPRPAPVRSETSATCTMCQFNTPFRGSVLDKICSSDHPQVSCISTYSRLTLLWDNRHEGPNQCVKHSLSLSSRQYEAIFRSC